ncbi:D-alanyl-D-alanine carboxypeptidase family protein [uncultured Corynebacterium sp.]|uniref:D-alanyl-D-alanine carboxypeptidase family protein n=1 Tax=uncultured Corynebacterium sp. TaxID=159447 RepID=UPI0025D52CEE|nr:serine hydrolase [uncultured Corynebacterium sp.]
MNHSPRFRSAAAAHRAAALAVTASLTLAVSPAVSAPLSSAAPMTSEPAAPSAASTAPGEEEDVTGPDPGRRDTRDCAFRTTPPAPVDTSEVPAPGSPSPEPLPVPEKPAGGPRMAECDVVVPDGFEVPEDVAASSWIVFDAADGHVVAAKDPHGRYRPASIAKVLLALVALEELPLDRTLTATFEDASIEGSRAGILEGVDYGVETLLLGLIMNSGNDAGSVLAGALGGREETVRKVNRKARELGATDTRIADFTGLDGPGQVTSAFDMALFYSAAFADPEYRRLSATALTEMPGDDDAGVEGFTMSNDNQLLASGFEGALGGKTGFTDDARHTFVGVAEREGRRLGAVVLDTTTDDGPRPWQQTAALLDEGFATPRQASVGDLSTPASGDDSGVLDAGDMEDEVLEATDLEDGNGARSTTEIAAVLFAGGLVLAVIGWWGLRRPGGQRRSSRH